MDVNIIIKDRAILGEGAIWDYKSGQLHWIDIEAKLLHCYNPITKKNQTTVLPKRIGTVVPCDNEALLLALEDGLYYQNKQGKLNSCIQKIEAGLNTNRCNDGKCDAKGRLWVGTMSLSADVPTGNLYKYSSIQGLQQVKNKITVSNGLAWNATNDTMYYIDTATSTIDIFDFDLKKGKIIGSKGKIKIPLNMGYPDGMTIDSEGMLWVALWNGAAVIRCNPLTEKIEDKIDLPGKHITSCAFGNKDLSTLYITSASIGLSKETLKKYPYSGSLFAINVGVKGVPANYFKT